MKLTHILRSLRPLCFNRELFIYKRTLDHLKSWRLVIPSSLKQITITLSLQDKERTQSPHWGAWLFVCENVPQLKYHNPSVKFTVNQHDEDISILEFKSGTGEVNTCTISGMNQKDIIEELERQFIDSTVDDSQTQLT